MTKLPSSSNSQRFVVDSSDLTGEDGFELVESVEELFMSHEEWMWGTHLTIGWRSPALLQLDEAIKIAERISVDMNFVEEEASVRFSTGIQHKNLEVIRDSMKAEAVHLVLTAFQRWAKEEGDWRNSRRNHTRRASRLHSQLAKHLGASSDADVRGLSQAKPITSLDELEKTQNAELFRGATTKFRDIDLDHAFDSNADRRALTSGFDAISKSGSLAKSIIEACFGHQSSQLQSDPKLAVILEAIIPKLASSIKIFTDALPGINVAIGFAQLTKILASIHTGSAQKQSIRTIEYALPTGDAKAAVAAIQECQQAYLREQKKQATMVATVTTLNLASLLCPGFHLPAAVAGYLKNVENMVAVVEKIAKQYHQMKAIEAYLATVTSIDSSIFKTSPLVGAYYVLNCSMSTLSRHIVPFSSPTFMEDTEYLRNSGMFYDLLSVAERIISENHFELIHSSGRPFRKSEGMSAANQAALWGSHKKRAMDRAINKAKVKFNAMIDNVSEKLNRKAA